MSGAVVSKNLYEILGNDPELDPDRAPEPPTKAIDKPVARAGKRNAGPEPPVRDANRPQRSGRADGATGNELAFRDRNAGRDQNRSKPSEEGGFRGDRGERGGYRGRGGRGRGGPRPPRDDRHSKTGVADHEKQAAHGWGGQTGNEEFADEKAGDAIAEAEQKDEGAAAQEPEGGADAVEPEEDKTKSFSAWQAEQEAKRAALGQSLEVRKANEGSSKKFPEGKAIARDEEEESYIAGAGGKKKRERERKEKSVLELDNPKMYDQPREFSGRGRGGRGGRGGESRGGEGRGRGGRGRGEFRGGRGARGGAQGGPNVDDQKAFPSLGA